MTLHAFIQYIIYKWKAKGRHGTHSPFVYALIDKGIYQTKAASLKEFLLSYFSNRTVLFLDADAAMRNISGAREPVIIAVKGIHTTSEATKQWNQLCQDPRIRLSLDLYEYGLLFFDEAFNQKQHFVVRYPA